MNRPFLLAVALLAIPAVPLRAAWPAGPSCTPSTAEGYEITRCQTVTQAPHGWVGRKTTDRESRTGVVPDETYGNSTEFVMTIGGWAKKCPTAEGVVDGVFEYVITKDDVISDETETRRSHYHHRLDAKLKGQVSDDAKLLYVEIEGEFTRQQDGRPTERRTLPRTRFTPGSSGEPDWEAMRRTVEVTGDLSFATAMLMAGPYYMNAQLEWSKSNACVEFVFDPPTDTRALGASQTADVRADVRTKGDQPAVVARWGKFVAGAIEGNGRVEPPRESDAPTDSPHTIRYTASAQPKRGHGFNIGALTRAGFADAKWRIIQDDDYELHLESTVVSRDPIFAAQSRAQGSVRLTASTKPYKLKPDGKLYRLYDGTGEIAFHTQSLRTDPCDPLIEGTGKSMLTVVDTWIVITPPQVQNGVQVSGKADIVLAYTLSMGAGETLTRPAYINYACVPGKVNAEPFWWSSYLTGREENGGEINFLKDWEYIGQDEIVAKKTLRSSCLGGCDEEHSVFTLRRVRPR